MANGTTKSTTVGSGSGQSYKLEVNWYVREQNIEKNKSRIDAWANLSGQYVGWNSTTVEMWLYFVDDANNSSTEIAHGSWTSGGYLNGGTRTLANSSHWHTHHSDGTLKGHLWCKIRSSGSNAYTPNATDFDTSTVQVDTIPRASSCTLSSAKVELGNTVTFTISPQSSSFGHKLFYMINDTETKICDISAGTTSYTWTVPTSLASSITTSTEATVQTKLKTYSGDTVVGTADNDLTLVVPSSYVPTINNVACVDASTNADIVSKFGGFIQNKSILKYTIQATGYSGSSVISANLSIAGVNYSTQTFTVSNGISTGYITTNTINQNGTVNYTVSVTDSRGRTTSKTSSLTMREYFYPAITKAIASRGTKNSSGVVTANETEGTYAYLNFAYKVSKINGLSGTGGRNLFANSSLRENSNNWGYGSSNSGLTFEFVTKENYPCFHINSSLFQKVFYISQSMLKKCVANTEYTMSGWYYTENIVKGSTNYTLLNSYTNGFYMKDGTRTWFGAKTSNMLLNTGKWVYFTNTFTTPTSDIWDNATTFDMMLYGRDFTGDIYVRDLKLEKGNKATDWSPAPEDSSNTVDFKIQYRKLGMNGTTGLAWTNVYTNTTDYTYDGVYNGAGNIFSDMSDTYEVRFGIKDYFSTDYAWQTVTITPSYTLINFGKGGKSIALFGQSSDGTDTLEINGTAYLLVNKVKQSLNSIITRFLNVETWQQSINSWKSTTDTWKTDVLAGSTEVAIAPDSVYVPVGSEPVKMYLKKVDDFVMCHISYVGKLNSADWTGVIPEGYRPITRMTVRCAPMVNNSFYDSQVIWVAETDGTLHHITNKTASLERHASMCWKVS